MRPPGFLRATAGLALALAGCAAPVAAPTVPGVGFTLVAVPDPGGPPPSAAPAAGLPPPVAPNAVPPPVAMATPRPVVASPAAAPVAAPAGGGSGDGGSVLPPAPTPVPLDPTLAHLHLPDGSVVQLPPGDAVAAPAGAQGELWLEAPDRVPSTVVAPAGTLVFHPRVASAALPPTTTVHVTGQVSPATAGLIVQFLAPGRTDFVGTTTAADGSFAFDAPVAGPTDGLVLARDPGEPPRLGLARVSLDPAGGGATANLTLEDPGPSTVAPAAPLRLLGFGNYPPAYPTPPSGMTYEAALLQVLEGQGGNGWAATLISSASLLIPDYALHGFHQAALLRAATPDHSQGSTTLGPPGGPWRAPLDAPDLSTLSAPAAGARLSWPAVTGAQLYVARLYAPDVADPPLWEGATSGTSLTVPAALTSLAAGCVLQLDAWDSPGVTVYSVASLPVGPRQLRVPAQPPAETGRHSWSRRAFTP